MPMPVTEIEPIRQTLAARLQLVIPTLTWQQASRWTYQPDREIAGTLRNFNLIFGPEREVVTDDRGVQGAYSGGIEYASDVELRVAYPVSEAELPRFLGSDARDVTALLETLHQFVPGMFAQTWSLADRIVPTWTGTAGAYIGTLPFTIRFFAVDTVQVAS